MTSTHAAMIAIRDDNDLLSVNEVQALVDALDNQIEDMKQYATGSDPDAPMSQADLERLKARLAGKIDAHYAMQQEPINEVQVTPKAYPLNHRRYEHGTSKMNDALCEWLEGWYAIADQLKTMPAGTQARLVEDGQFVGTLVMAPMNGELYMFWAGLEALNDEPAKCSLGGPQNRVLAQRAETYIKNARLMRKWLAKPQFDTPTDPKHLAAVVHHYYGAKSDGAWVWDGNAPIKIV